MFFCVPSFSTANKIQSINCNKFTTGGEWNQNRASQHQSKVVTVKVSNIGLGSLKAFSSEDCQGLGWHIDSINKPIENYM